MAGTQAILLYPSGLHYITAFFGCLYAKVVAIPAYPPHAARMIPRIQAIVQDAQATLVLTTKQIRLNIQQWFADVPELEQLEWLTTDDIPQDLADNWRESTVTPDTLAFLQYTSGSTATPKGFMVSHGNLMHNLAFQSESFDHNTESVNVSWLPIFHDLGLIAGVLQPLYAGFPAYIMSPTSFMQRPMRCLQTISMYRGTSSYAPNFAFEVCMKHSTPEERANLDLSSWRIALNGAEPVRRDMLQRFAAMFAPSGFRAEFFIPAYGLTEATLVVSCDAKDADPVIKTLDKAKLEQHRIVETTPGGRNSLPLVGCGTTGHDQKIMIAHPVERTTCSEGEVGEIWVAGKSVAQGYRRRQEETEHSFHAYLTDTGKGPFLRTGDLGFYKDGQLFITGRMKDVIIIHGRNHYPQDIELTTERVHPSVRLECCAAFSVDVHNEERLVIAAEINPHDKPDTGHV